MTIRVDEDLKRQQKLIQAPRAAARSPPAQDHPGRPRRPRRGTRPPPQFNQGEIEWQTNTHHSSTTRGPLLRQGIPRDREDLVRQAAGAGLESGQARQAQISCAKKKVCRFLRR